MTQICLVLFIAAFLAWIVSTVAGGGGGMLMIPIIAWVANPKAVAPAFSLGTLLSSPMRVWIFWKDIDWRIVRWYLPGAIAGALLGGYIFARIPPAWVKVLAAVFLLSTLFQYRFGERQRSFPMRVWIFLPLGFIVAAISGMIGEAGPVLNPFFLNYGVDKEAMIATKSVNSFFMQLTKIGSYVAFGAMAHEFWLYGIAIGIAASLASWVGKTLLHRMDGKQFRRTVVVVMVIAGALMLWQERSLFMRWAR
jgi:uncharacterized membrane protein YfcA